MQIHTALNKVSQATNRIRPQAEGRGMGGQIENVADALIVFRPVTGITPRGGSWDRRSRTRPRTDSPRGGGVLALRSTVRGGS